MKPSRIASLLTVAAGLAVASGVMLPNAGFTRASHTTRRRTDPVQRYRAKDPAIEKWNRDVDARKRAKKGRP